MFPSFICKFISKLPSDGVDKDLMDLIDDHWGTFPPQHPLVNHIVGIAYFILCIINYVGNGSVVYIFLKVKYVLTKIVSNVWKFKVKSLRTPSNMFVVNLAFSDLCMMITQGPSVIINCFTDRIWMWGHLGKWSDMIHLTKWWNLICIRMQALCFYWGTFWCHFYHHHGHHRIWQIQCHCKGEMIF